MMRSQTMLMRFRSVKANLSSKSVMFARTHDVEPLGDAGIDWSGWLSGVSRNLAVELIFANQAWRVLVVGSLAVE